MHSLAQCLLHSLVAITQLMVFIGTQQLASLFLGRLLQEFYKQIIVLFFQLQVSSVYLSSLNLVFLPSRVNTNLTKFFFCQLTLAHRPGLAASPSHSELRSFYLQQQQSLNIDWNDDTVGMRKCFLIPFTWKSFSFRRTQQKTKEEELPVLYPHCQSLVALASFHTQETRHYQVSLSSPSEASSCDHSCTPSHVGTRGTSVGFTDVGNCIGFHCIYSKKIR